MDWEDWFILAFQEYVLGLVRVGGVEGASYVCPAGIAEASAADKRSHSWLNAFNNEEIIPKHCLLGYNQSKEHF